MPAEWPDLSDGGVIDEQDPGEALLPGSANDVPHQPPLIVPGDLDYVDPATDVEPHDDAGDEGPDTEPLRPAAP